MFLKISPWCFPMNTAISLRTSFLYKTYHSCFFLFDKVTVQYWAPVNLNQDLNKEHNMWCGWFLLKRFADLFRVCYITSRNHFNTFLLINCRKQKLAQSKTLQQGLFILISDFWQFRHSHFSWGKSNLKEIWASSRKVTWNLDNIKSSFGVSF